MNVLTIITGVLLAILGVYAACIPFRVFLGLGWLLGALFLINGIEMSAVGFAKKKSAWEGILGILIAICGLIILCNGVQRFLTDLMLVFLVGGVVVANGIILIYTSVKETMKTSKGMGVLGILCGAAEIILGFFAFGHPILTMISVGYIVAFSVVLQGIDLVLLGFAIGKAKKALSAEA